MPVLEDNDGLHEDYTTSIKFGQILNLNSTPYCELLKNKYAKKAKKQQQQKKHCAVQLYSSIVLHCLLGRGAESCLR